MAQASTTTTSEQVQTRSGRGLVWLGASVFLLGFILYLLQIEARFFWVPWYLPMLGTVGAGLIVRAFLKRKTVVRFLLAGVLGLLAVGQWVFLLWLTRIPAYAGPAAIQRTLPDFATQTADGTPFTQADLRGERNTALVFFRGRW